MGLVGGRIGYLMLKRIGGADRLNYNEEYVEGQHPSLERWFGPTVVETIQGKTVIDFGCGEGLQSVELAQRGAKRVIGLELLPERLRLAEARAKKYGVANTCTFSTDTDEVADVIISKDAFEHFDDPGSVLQTMHEKLTPGGVVLASFGPTWLHPRGGHGFSVFPWSHLLFTERAQMRWRGDYKQDGATRFEEVEGGLNKITISQFESLVQSSPLELDWIETSPIRGVRLLKTKLLREFGTSIVRCQLSRRVSETTSEDMGS